MQDEGVQAEQGDRDNPLHSLYEEENLSIIEREVQRRNLKYCIGGQQ